MQEWLYFGVWRWCIFLAGISPIYFLAELLVHLLFLCAESHFFTLRYAFYYAVSVKVRGATYCLYNEDQTYTTAWCKWQCELNQTDIDWTSPLHVSFLALGEDAMRAACLS